MHLTETEIMGGIDTGGDDSPYFPGDDDVPVQRSSKIIDRYDPDLPMSFFAEKPLARLNTNNPFAQRINLANDELKKDTEHFDVIYPRDEKKKKKAPRFKIDVTLLFVVIIVLAIFAIMQFVQIQMIQRLMRDLIVAKK